MTWAPTETQKSIHNKLANDMVLTQLLGGAGRIFDFVPDNTSYPFVVLQIKPWADRGNHTHEGLSAEPTIHVFYRAPGRGDLKVQEIQARIDALLHDIDVCVEGWNIIVLRRAFVDIIVEPDNVTLHGVQRFKLFLGEA